MKARFISSFREKFVQQAKLQDIVVVFGLFVFSSVLVVGLFPRDASGSEAGQVFFLYVMMAIPVIMAMYFIVISFRRKISRDLQNIDTSIRTKISLAFMFVAILPSLPIVLISNNIINRSISELISGETPRVIERAGTLARNEIYLIGDGMRQDANLLRDASERGLCDPSTLDGRFHTRQILASRNVSLVALVRDPAGRGYVAADNFGSADALRDGLQKTFSLARADLMPADGRMTVSGQQVLYSTVQCGPFLYVLYRAVPEQAVSDIKYFAWAAERYARREYVRPYLRSMVGVVLFVISFVIAGMAVVLSLVLSKNITRPVLELNEAARAVASGNFTIRVYRDSSDELSLLYRSFNAMVQQLDESRKAVFHIQKLEAWREVGRKLMHEIKNPLTPIKLSAERMRRRYKENHPDIERIILSGTETIIEEVNALEHILGEFTRFARLPEAVLAPHELNRMLENCANLYSSHEHVQIVLSLDEKIGMVRYDKVLLRQAVINLLKNAVEAFDGEPGIIEVMSKLKDEKTVLLSIRDNGPGIAPDDLEQLFEPTFSRKANGSGLGLAIVEKIVIEHKGRISCKSELGFGAQFVITLPLNTIDREQDIIHGTNSDR